ncbi:Type I restriction endonuclease subunit M [Vibrio owensii]|uniref:Type I restriction endonuclease subunit M n=1 Tax=Vibrio owensii TaxID=696485 RepID=A0AAU9QBY3_9VIBR|nr:Type I restriction endonuclease subunit M [Vibrio owensii]
MNTINITSHDEQLKAQTYVCTAIAFDLGDIVYTQGVASMLENNLGMNLMIYLQRHQNGDWGNICVEDKIINDEATRAGERVLSSYQLCGRTIWIITERGRSVTTILLPMNIDVLS